MSSTPRDPEDARRLRVADAIEACIRELKMSYKDVAQKAGISEAGLRNIRNRKNRANPGTLRALSGVFRREPEYLETIRDSEPQQSPTPLSVAERTLQEILVKVTGADDMMTAIFDRLDRIEKKLDQEGRP